MSDETLARLKESAEFFPAGRIIPQRIMKGQRKFKRLVIFDADTWVLNSNGGYVCMADTRNGDCAMRILNDRAKSGNVSFTTKSKYRPRKSEKMVLRGSPYHVNGSTCFCGNSGITDEQWVSNTLAAINKQKGEA
jgi:hypothetical protein